MKSQPLTDTELDHLSAVLERFGDTHSMNLEQLDGFLAALICGPELVPPSKYLPKIWGNKPVFEDQDHGGSLCAIFALANEHNPDPKMRPYKDPISTELRETLIVSRRRAR